MTRARPMKTDPRLRSLLASAVVALMLITPSALAAQPLVPKPLPAPVLSQAPGIRPLGRGRHTIWGIRVYDATLSVVGERFTPAQPPRWYPDTGKSVSADTMINNAMDEIRKAQTRRRVAARILASGDEATGTERELRQPSRGVLPERSEDAGILQRTHPR